ncbi:MAG: helix-turn-helix transcriptional regulator [Rhodoferax sp.]|nr:helix-turn-helix transcriptional regulator [Rhodoferax sp.]
MEPVTTKDKVLDAATRVFLAHGFTAAAMDMVRAEAGVSNGSLYHHFQPSVAGRCVVCPHAARRPYCAAAPIAGNATAEAGVKGAGTCLRPVGAAAPGAGRACCKLRRTQGHDGEHRAWRGQYRRLWRTHAVDRPTGGGWRHAGHALPRVDGAGVFAGAVAHPALGDPGQTRRAPQGACRAGAWRVDGRCGLSNNSFNRRSAS